MERIAKIIHNDQRLGRVRTYHLVFCPQKSVLSIQALEQAGVLRNLVITAFNFDLIPLEHDLLSLELNNYEKEVYLEKDASCFHLIADSIQRLQLLYGQFYRIFMKGDAAKVL